MHRLTTVLTIMLSEKHLWGWGGNISVVYLSYSYHSWWSHKL